MDAEQKEENTGRRHEKRHGEKDRERNGRYKGNDEKSVSHSIRGSQW